MGGGGGEGRNLTEKKKNGSKIVCLRWDVMVHGENKELVATNCTLVHVGLIPAHSVPVCVGATIKLTIVRKVVSL